MKIAKKIKGIVEKHHQLNGISSIIAGLFIMLLTFLHFLIDKTAYLRATFLHLHTLHISFIQLLDSLTRQNNKASRQSAIEGWLPGFKYQQSAIAHKQCTIIYQQNTISSQQHPMLHHQCSILHQQNSIYPPQEKINKVLRGNSYTFSENNNQISNPNYFIYYG